MDESVDLEVRHHIEMRTDELIDEGYSRNEARRIAEEAFGDVAMYRAECVRLQRREERKMRWMEWMSDLWRDVAIGLRGLKKNPVFALTVLLTLGIGVGANAAIFTVVDAALVRPWPYENVERIVSVRPRETGSPWASITTTAETALAWRDESDLFEEVGLFRSLTVVRTDGDVPERLRLHQIGPSIMRIFGVAPLVGRLLGEDDAAPGAEPVVVISERVWKRIFGGASDVIGRSVTLDGVAHLVVGVMPEHFRVPFPDAWELWAPLGADHFTEMADGGHVAIMALLPPDLPIDRARERAAAFQAGLAESGLDTGGANDVLLNPISAWRANPDIEKALWLLFGASTLILLIAGVNAANLFLVRGSKRTSEIGLRIALGGARRRVIRQVALEAGLLAIGSVLIALAISQLTLHGIVVLAPRAISEWTVHPIEVGGRVAAFSLVIAAVGGLLFGLLPAARVVFGVAPLGRVAQTSRRVIGRGRQRWMGPLVAVEVGLSVVLLFGAGVFVRNFVQIVRTDPGFDPHGVVTLTPDLSLARYPTPTVQRAFFEGLRERVGGLPGVVSVALSVGAPPHSLVMLGDTLMAEGLGSPEEAQIVVPYALVAADFFEAFRMPIVAGRPFGPGDTPASGARIIDQETARWLFGEDAPIGKRFRMGRDGDWWTVVGVVRDMHLMGLADRNRRFELLTPLASDRGSRRMTLSVRTNGDAARLVPELRRVVAEIDPGQPAGTIQIVSEALVDTLERDRFVLRLMAAFGAMAIILAGLGLYGVISYVVQQRRREMGIRIALGAGRGDITRGVLRTGFAMAASGVVIGVGSAFYLARFAELLVQDVETRDPLVLAATAVTILGISAVATVLPARRAVRVDPIEVLSAD